MKKIMTFLSILMVACISTIGQDSWSFIMIENFEDTFPSGNWSTFHNIIDPNYGGGNPPWVTIDSYWGKSGFRHHAGGWSGWCAGDGTFIVDPDPNSGQGYVACIDSWMTYGPFNLTDPGTSDAELNFWYAWNGYPEFCYGYFVVRVTTDTSLWNPPYEILNDVIDTLDFTNTTGNADDPLVWVQKIISLSNYIGQSGLFIGIQFYDPWKKDAPSYNCGGWVDDIVLRKDVNVGFDDNTPHSSLAVYPNPSNGNFTVDNLKPNTLLTITDMSGRYVHETTTTSNRMNFKLDVPSGFYLMKSGDVIEKIVLY